VISHTLIDSQAVTSKGVGRYVILACDILTIHTLHNTYDCNSPYDAFVHKYLIRKKEVFERKEVTWSQLVNISVLFHLKQCMTKTSAVFVRRLQK
jgi:hypothetical protein